MSEITENKEAKIETPAETKTIRIADLFKMTGPAIIPIGETENMQIESIEIHETENPANDYATIILVAEDGRKIQERRNMNQMRVMISHLREQLKLQTSECSYEDLLKPRNHKFTIWVTRNLGNDGTKIFKNINYLKPLNFQTETRKDNAAAATKTTPVVTPPPAPPAPEMKIIEPEDFEDGDLPF